MVRTPASRRAAPFLVVALAALTAACGMQTAPDHALLRETGPAAPPTTLLAEAEPVSGTPPVDAALADAPAGLAAAPAEHAPVQPDPSARVIAARTAPVVSSVLGSLEPYRGLGTWVDVYDWSHYKETTPTVGPDQVDQMAAEGVQTLFIQTAKHDTPELISERELLEPIIHRAHLHGIRVVAWYLPTLEDVDNDLNRLVASANLDVDGVAVDIESRKVADANERSLRLIDLSTRLREALPGRAIGAIVMPPVQLEVVNPSFWPGFPWREIAAKYDVWQTMGYWTDRKQSSGYRDPYRYTAENQQRLRHNLGNPSAPISPVGGVGALGNGDIEAFLRAAAEQGAMGGSIYDWRTTRAEAWPALRGFRSTP